VHRDVIQDSAADLRFSLSDLRAVDGVSDRTYTLHIIIQTVYLKTQAVQSVVVARKQPGFR
jgi:hypothetical protein